MCAAALVAITMPTQPQLLAGALLLFFLLMGVHAQYMYAYNCVGFCFFSHGVVPIERGPNFTSLYEMYLRVSALDAVQSIDAALLRSK